MGVIASAISCIQSSSMSTEEKARVIDEIRKISWDSDSGELSLSSADLQEIVGNKMERELRQYAKKLHQKEVQLKTMFELHDNLVAFSQKHGIGSVDKDGKLVQLMNDVLTQDLFGVAYNAKIKNIDNHAEYIHAQFSQMIGPTLHRFREKIMGLSRDPQEQKKLVKAIFGESSGDPELDALGKAIADMNEKMRVMYNDAGGTIEKRAHYAFQSVYDPGAMVDKFGSPESFASHIKGLIDEGKATFYNPVNGEPFSGDSLDAALHIMYENVVTGKKDSPMVNFRFTDPDGKQHTLKSSVFDEKKSVLEANLQKPIDDKLAKKLDEDIAKLSAKEKSGNITENQIGRLERLREERAAIMSEAQYEKDARMLESMDSPEKIGFSGERLGEQTIPDMRSHERNLVFNDADTWNSWHEMMGVTDIVSQIYSNMDSMSKEIALMKTFGPDVDRGYKMMRDFVLSKNPDRKQVKGLFGKNKLVQKWFSTEKMWDGYMRVLKGDVNAGGSYGAAKFAGAVRNLTTATLLPGSTTTVLAGDIGTSIVAASATGTSRFEVFAKYLVNAFQKNSPAVMDFYIGANHLMNTMNSHNRFTETALSNAGTAKGADMVLRAAGVTSLTKSGDMNFALHMNANLARNITKSWDRLPTKWRKTVLERFGITKDDWAEIQKAAPALTYIDSSGKTVKKKGVFATPYLDLSAIDVYVDTELASRFRESFVYATQAYRKMAVLQATTQSRYITTGFGASQEEGAGLAGRLLTQFMSFAIAFQNTHINYALRSVKEGQGYGALATLAATTTTTGALMMLLDDLKKGRDPRTVFKEDESKLKSLSFYLGDSFMRAGGLGYYGDLVAAMGQGDEGVGKKLMGPGVGLIVRGGQTFLDAVNDSFDEDSDRSFQEIGAQVAMGAWDLSPTRAHIASSTAHQIVLKAISDMLSPGLYEDKLARKERYWYDELGTESFVRQGEDVLPYRAPDFSNMAGD